ncbi:MAG: septum site-determining protein MinC [Azospirillum sp.]|nr:septum site-determining protein MinC [Azospirillum sp.]
MSVDPRTLATAAVLPDGEPSFQLRGSAFTMMVLKINEARAGALVTELQDKVRQAPNFFRNAPIVVDLDGLSDDMRRIDLSGLVARLRSLQLIVVGVQGGSRNQQTAAIAAGLPVVPSGRPARLEPVAPTVTGVAAEALSAGTVAEPTTARQPTMIVNEPVRSGRQIYAQNCDLIVTAMVSAGAELLADGNIHVYGALRGRALAGLGGDKGARIFCLSMEAEMLSVAGLYLVSEDIDPAVHRKPAQVHLKDGYLRLDAI